MFKYRNFVSWFFGAVFMSMFFAACSDDNVGDNENDSSEEADTLADYTVITLMQPGNNDLSLIADFCQMIINREEGKIGNNVNVVGIFKPSPRFQKGAEIDYCVKFDLGKSKLSADKLKELKDLKATTDNLFDEKTKIGNDSVAMMAFNDKIGALYRDYILSNLDCSKYCSLDTGINNAETISTLIKEAVALHPAKHYIFVLYGHGFGYDPFIENRFSQTRTCLSDLYINSQLTLDKFIQGIKDSGVKFDLLLTQCCLMATLENMTAYSTLFDFYVGSAEITTSGYFPEFLAKFSDVKGEEQKLTTAMHDVVDYYASIVQKETESGDRKNATSTGFYDLRKMAALNAVVKKASDWLIDANKEDPTYMRDVIINSFYAKDESLDTIFNRTNEETVALCRDFFIHPENHKDISIKELHNVFLLMDSVNLQKLEIDYNFIMATILKNAIVNKPNAKTDANIDFGAMESIYNEYMSQLKDMAYINGNKTKGEDVDYYLYCSPSVQLVNFNDNCFIPLWTSDFTNWNGMLEDVQKCLQNDNVEGLRQLLELVYAGNWYAYMYYSYYSQSYQMGTFVGGISRIYCSTLFHEATGWGDLLQQTRYNPHLLYNPCRKVK